jgi:hypothetical protein
MEVSKFNIFSTLHILIFFIGHFFVNGRMELYKLLYIIIYLFFKISKLGLPNAYIRSFVFIKYFIR